MTTPINDLQNHFAFQLSLLKLGSIQNESESISAALPVEVSQQQLLHDELAKMAEAIH